MGSLFKKQYSRWYYPDGRRAKVAGAPGATQKKVIDKNWSVRYRDATGHLKEERLKFKEKSKACQELAEIEKRVEREQAGLIDTHLEQVKRPLIEHLDEWKDSLNERRITEKRRVEMDRRIRILVETAGWSRLTDITETSARKALNGLGVSIQTWNHYLQHLKQFVRWCVPERLESNPIAKLNRENVATDIRHDRRDLTDEEQSKLAGSTERSDVVRFELSGPSRAMLYRMALGTGFRRTELQSLTPASFDLENGTVTLAAKFSKHRKSDVQIMPKWLTDTIRKWLADGNPLWPNLTKHTSKMIRADLEAAGIPYRIEGINGPLFADFHSLRHTYVTMVSRMPIPVRDQMMLSRHSTAALFLQRYAKPSISNITECMSQAPDPTIKQSEG